MRALFCWIYWCLLSNYNEILHSDSQSIQGLINYTVLKFLNKNVSIWKYYNAIKSNITILLYYYTNYCTLQIMFSTFLI